ncbi:GSCFA domain-containing protein [Novosphingobium sp.]|uniref:GSCFA domain-containing protein n=1 Tax=Novosphingobium sp. TaxID=1874826 RepID=UPI0038B6E464
MPLLTLSGPDAMANLKANPAATWPMRGSFGSRLEPLAKPGFTPSFKLAAGEPIFTIGSCFARHVETMLEQCGFAIPSRAAVKADPQFALIGHNILNNYGVPSIRNELRWALDPACPFTEDQAFVEVTPGKFVDLHLNHAIKPTSLDVVRARRRAILAGYQAVRDCRVVIVTLGLAECWFDTWTGIYLNTAPRRSLLRRWPERFQLHVLDYADVLAGLEEILALLRNHGHPDLRVMMTVSPVPLTSTFRAQDVMLANTYSKAVLRAAAEAVCLRHDWVDYYPSFESVTLSERGAALEDDMVHPTHGAIWLNTTRMIRAYVGADALGPQDIAATIAENPMAALTLLAEREDLLAADPALAMALYGAAAKAGRMDLLERALGHVGDRVPADEQDLTRARIALSRGDVVGALALLQHEPARRAARGQFWATKLNAQLAQGDLEAARMVAQGWSASNPRTAEPFRLLGVAYAARRQFDAALRLFEAALDLSDDDARVLLDYADLLLQTGRRSEAQALLDTIHPGNPAQTDRLARLRLWAWDSIAPIPVDAAPAFQPDFDDIYEEVDVQ